ncbi:MAG: hypothetical protein AB7G28_06110 [Pirellulales bacterium]
MADTKQITVKHIALGMALVGLLSTPLYLLGRYDSLIPCLGLLGPAPSWCATAVAAYGVCRYSAREYALAFFLGLVGTIFWAWAVYDGNVLQYSR